MKTEEVRKKYLESNKVHVQYGSWSDKPCCFKKNCKKKDKYMVFVGGHQLSNLQGCSCSDHLSDLIDKAIKYRDNYIDDLMKEYRKKKVLEAAALLEESESKRILLNHKIKKVTKV